MINFFNKWYGFLSFIVSIIVFLSSTTVGGYIIHSIKKAQKIDKNIHISTFVVWVIVAIVAIMVINLITNIYFFFLKKEIKGAKYIKINLENYLDNEGKTYLSTSDNVKATVERTKNSMSNLQKAKSTETLSSDIYYLYLFALFYGAKKRIWATSILGEGEWIDTPEEREFLRLNLQMSRKKVLVERIFIVDIKSIPIIFDCHPIIEQINKRSEYLKTYIVFKDTLTERNINLLTDIGSGFLAFDDFAIAVDSFHYSEIRGTLHLDKNIVDQYNIIFTNLRDYATPLDNIFLEKYKILRK